MGYYGDIAFAIVTQDTGGSDGGPIDGPLIAKFLDALRSDGMILSPALPRAGP